MPDSTRNANRVLSQSAARSEATVPTVGDLKSGASTLWQIYSRINRVRNIVTQGVDALPKNMALSYVDFFKAHLNVLAQILMSVQRGADVEAQIDQIRQNLDAYESTAKQFATEARTQIPSEPKEAIRGGAIVIFLAPLLLQDASFVQAWNDYLNTYEQLVRTALDTCQAYIDMGANIQSQTTQEVVRIREAIDALPKKNDMDMVLKGTYNERLKWIEFTVIQRIPSVVGNCRTTVAYLQNALLTAQRIQRLQPNSP